MASDDDDDVRREAEIGVSDVGMGTGAGDVRGMSDVGDVALTIGVGQVEMGTSAGDVTTVSDVDDVTVTT